MWLGRLAHGQFSIPDWYYAQLIGVQFYFSNPVEVDPMQPFFQFNISRGGVILIKWNTEELCRLSENYYVCMWVNAPYICRHIDAYDPWQMRLPPDLYMYPGDVFSLETKALHRNAEVLDVVLTFKIWEI